MKKEHAIAIDLGGTNLRVALVTREGEIRQRIKVPSQERLEEALLGAVKELLTDGVAGIGIGVAGLLNRERTAVEVSPNIPAIEGAPLVERLRERSGLPVYIENDANVAALGESWLGAGRDFRNFVLLTLGTGIGGGIIHDGSLMQVEAELGHMSIIANGVKCSCGSYGCLESYAGGKAILGFAVTALEHDAESVLRNFHQGNIYKLTPEDIYAAALDGDILSRDVLREAGRYLGVGLANIINICSPEAVILAGGLVGAWNIYIHEAIREASRRAFRQLFEKVKIIPSSLGDNAGLVGAACLVFRNAETG